MGFRITEENKPSYHHIIKAEELRHNKESDIATIENGAYLGKKSHELLHKIEVIDKDLYDLWNNLFLEINRLGTYPTEELWSMVYILQDKSIHCLDKSKNVLKIVL